MFEHELIARAREFAAVGKYEQAALCSEQGGDCANAVRFYRQAGKLKLAARCFESFGRLEEAAQCYLAIGDKVSAERVRNAAMKIKRRYSTPWYDDVPCVDESERPSKDRITRKTNKPKRHATPTLKPTARKWDCKECQLTFTTPYEANRHKRDRHPIGFEDRMSPRSAANFADDQDSIVSIQRLNEIGEIQGLMRNNGHTKPRSSHYTRPYGYFNNAKQDGMDRRFF